MSYEHISDIAAKLADHDGSLAQCVLEEIALIIEHAEDAGDMAFGISNALAVYLDSRTKEAGAPT